MKFRAGDIVSNGYYWQIILQVNPGVYLSVVLSYGENGHSYRSYEEPEGYIDTYYEIERKPL